MNKRLVSKMQRVQELLVELEDEIRDEIDAIQEKMDALEEKASYRDSGEMTEREQERYEELEYDREALEEVITELECCRVFERVEEYFEW